MNRKLLSFKWFLLVIVLLAAVALPASWTAAGPSAATATESEPNDSIALANPIAIGDTSAAISPVEDVDYFRLSLNQGQRIYVAALADCASYELEISLAMLDAGGTVLAQPGEWPDYNVLFVFTAPATADYYVRVKSVSSIYSPEESTGGYNLVTRLVPADEPDDHFAPVPIPFNSTIDSSLFAPYDFDYFSIHARPGDIFKMSLTMNPLVSGEGRLSIDDAAYTYPYGSNPYMVEPGTVNIVFTVPFESDYIVRVDNSIFHCNSSAPQPYHLTIERNSLYVAGNKAGTVNGVAFGANDILARNTAGQWRKVFDGEDVGLNGALGGFEFLDDGSILMSLLAGSSLPGIGAVKPQDIVRFAPTQLGADTQGAFSFYLRGTQVGLTTLGERIDGIAVLDDGRVMISPTGSASVPKSGGGALGARNEDLLLFHPDGPMPSTGSWSLEMDATAYLPKFSTLDLHAVTVTSDGYEDSYWGPFHQVRALFALDRPYTYTAWLDNGYSRFTAAPGDVLNIYYSASHDYPEAGLWPPIARSMTLGFPKIITSLSIGPGWNN